MTKSIGEQASDSSTELPCPAFSYDQEAYLALGRVVAESAMMDEILRAVLADLVGSDQSWLLWEGQNTDWLIQSCRLVMHECEAWGIVFSDEERAEFDELLVKMTQLRGLRNTVVHGVWLSSGTGDQARPRPWGTVKEDAGRVHYVLRSRLRRDFAEQLWTAKDVDRLADEIAAVCASTVRLFRLVVDGRRSWLEERLFGRW